MRCEPPKHVRYLGYSQRLPETNSLPPNHLTDDDLWPLMRLNLCTLNGEYFFPSRFLSRSRAQFPETQSFESLDSSDGLSMITSRRNTSACLVTTRN